MKIAEAILKESLRVHPVVSILFRKSKEETKVLGFKIQPGVI
jgi:cytochrome P450